MNEPFINIVLFGIKPSATTSSVILYLLYGCGRRWPMDGKIIIMILTPIAAHPAQLGGCCLRSAATFVGRERPFFYLFKFVFIFHISPSPVTFACCCLGSRRRSVYISRPHRAETMPKKKKRMKNKEILSFYRPITISSAALTYLDSIWIIALSHKIKAQQSGRLSRRSEFLLSYSI